VIIHRLAYLSRIRNVPNGLATRSEIINQLSTEKWTSTSDIAKNVPVTAGTVLYHLKNMQREDVVKRNSMTLDWRLTEVQQIALTEFLSTSQRKRK